MVPVSQFSRITIIRLLPDIHATVLRQSQVPKIPSFVVRVLYDYCPTLAPHVCEIQAKFGPGGARWLSGRVSDSGARGRGFETYRRHVVSLSKTLYSPKVLVNYPGSGGSIPT